MFNDQARPTISGSSLGLCFPAPSLGALTPALCQGRWWLPAETLDSGTLGCNHSCHHYEGQQKDHMALCLNSASLRLCPRVKIILHFLSIFQKQPDQRCPRKQKSALKSHHLHCIVARLLHIFKQTVSSESPKKKVLTTVVSQYPRGIGSRTPANGIRGYCNIYWKLIHL